MSRTPEITSENLHKIIDITLLRVDATFEQISFLCTKAVEKKYFSVCVPPYYVSVAKKFLNESPVNVCTVVGFPLGLSLTETKLQETEASLKNGASEIDCMWNLSAFKSGDLIAVKTDLRRLRILTQNFDAKLKIIIETGLLNPDELKRALELCTESDVDFVKTSTGFVNPGAEPEKVKLMRQFLPPHIGIKASGGIRTHEQALMFVTAGATRIGTSSYL